jgi:hypothetical protein
VLSSGLNDDGAGTLEQLLAFRGAQDADPLNWRPVSEALEALRGELTGPEQDRISNLLARIKDRQRSGRAAGAGIAAG